MRTVGQSVHSRMPPEFVLPDFVMLYLNKGSKYILDRHQRSPAEVMRSLDKMEVKMHTAKFFESKPSLAQQHVTKQHTRSDWKPPQDEQVARLNRLSWMSLFQDQSRAITLGWIAKQGSG